MNKRELQETIYEKITEAKDVILSDSPDVFEVDRLDMELTALMSSAGLVRAQAENEANTWKMITGSVQEIVRSLRKVHETYNTERRMN
jgi:hypothetical protein